jgi:hypothetical protein
MNEQNEEPGEPLRQPNESALPRQQVHTVRQAHGPSWGAQRHFSRPREPPEPRLPPPQRFQDAALGTGLPCTTSWNDLGQGDCLGPDVHQWSNESLLPFIQPLLNVNSADTGQQNREWAFPSAEPMSFTQPPSTHNNPAQSTSMQALQQLRLAQSVNWRPLYMLQAQGQSAAPSLSARHWSMGSTPASTAEPSQSTTPHLHTSQLSVEPAHAANETGSTFSMTLPTHSADPDPKLRGPWSDPTKRAVLMSNGVFSTALWVGSTSLPKPASWSVENKGVWSRKRKWEAGENILMRPTIEPTYVGQPAPLALWSQYE